MSAFESLIDAAIEHGKELAATWQFTEHDTFDDLVELAVRTHVNAETLTAPVASLLIADRPDILQVQPWSDGNVLEAIVSGVHQLAYEAIHNGIWDWTQQEGMNTGIETRYSGPPVY